jgi:hypothetical protein
MIKRLAFVFFIVVGVVVADSEYKIIGGGSRNVVDYATLNVTVSAGLSADTAAQILGKLEGFSVLYGRVILNPARSSYAGLGNSDSAYLWLYSRRFGNTRKLIDSSFRAALPCTLLTEVTSSVGDTLLIGDLELKWRIVDTLSDVAFQAQYPFDINITLK